MIELAREIDRAAMAEVAPVTQIHAHHGVARTENGGVDGVIRGSAAMGLHVRVLGVEQRLGSLDGQGFNPIDVFATAVVALARIAFGVFVVEQRAQCLQHGRTGDVLRGNQLQCVLLPFELVPDCGTNLRIDSIDAAGEIGLRLQHPAHYPEITAP